MHLSSRLLQRLLSDTYDLLSGNGMDMAHLGIDSEFHEEPPRRFILAVIAIRKHDLRPGSEAAHMPKHGIFYAAAEGSAAQHQIVQVETALNMLPSNGDTDGAKVAIAISQARRNTESIRHAVLNDPELFVSQRLAGQAQMCGIGRFQEVDISVTRR